MNIVVLITTYSCHVRSYQNHTLYSLSHPCLLYCYKNILTNTRGL